MAITPLSSEDFSSERGRHLVLLDLYRAVAAYGVAAAHFWAHLGSPAGEFWAAFSVELFFPLSGFVLAPQVNRVAAEVRALPVFYLRRWMRTLPPYWIALVLATALAGSAPLGDFLRYALFLQDTGWAYPVISLFPVAWSLAVEEWFYLLFPAWIWIGSRFRLPPLFGTLLFCGMVQALRLAAVLSGEGEALRTLTWFRLDAIALGFLLWKLAPIRHGWKLAVWLGIFFAGGAAGLVSLAGLASLSGWQKWAFIEAAMLCSVVILWASVQLEPDTVPRWFSSVCAWGGRVSYPMYLFHLFFIPWTAKKPAGIWIYLGGLTLFCAAFHLLIEQPLLIRRPKYPASKPQRVEGRGNL